MPTFNDDLVFPTEIGINSSGGPRWASEVEINDSGYEVRNNPWTYPLSDYDVSWGVKTVPDLETLIAIFHVSEAMTIGFRFRDPLDWKTCSRVSTIATDDQVLIASAAGGETTAQFRKGYTYGGVTLWRKLTRLFDTTLLEINGTPKTEGTHYSVDKATGIVDFTGGTTPNGALTATDVVKGGCHFHVPVRFNTNRIPIQLREYDLGSARVPLVEIRE